MYMCNITCTCVLYVHAYVNYTHAYTCISLFVLSFIVYVVFVCPQQEQLNEVLDAMFEKKVCYYGPSSSLSMSWCSLCVRDIKLELFT